jgi:hypothetical protein
MSPKTPYRARHREGNSQVTFSAPPSNRKPSALKHISFTVEHTPFWAR